jgi:hypothetical protein
MHTLIGGQIIGNADYYFWNHFRTGLVIGSIYLCIVFGDKNLDVPQQKYYAKVKPNRH